MRLVVSSLLVAVVSLGFAGCKKSADDIAEQSVKMMEEMAQIIDTNKGDCDKMGSALDTFITSKKDLIEKAKTLRGDKAQSKKLEEKYGPRLKEVTKKMIGGAMKCATNKTVGDAMKKMR